MEMTGEQLIPVPQAEVWRGLNDPEVLKACIAGCESIEKVSDNEYKVSIVASVGPVKAKFNGKLLLSDLNPPNSYSLSFEGSGGAAGFGKGGAQVSLKSESGGTRLSYSAKASVGGKLAQVGSRLIDGSRGKWPTTFSRPSTKSWRAGRETRGHHRAGRREEENPSRLVGRRRRAGRAPRVSRPSARTLTSEHRGRGKELRLGFRAVPFQALVDTLDDLVQGVALQPR